MSWWSRIRNAFQPDRVNREIDEELQSHLAEAKSRAGTPSEARRAFGSPLQRREETRDIHVAAWLHSLRMDAVFGWRQILKKKASSAAAVLSLALAIGACTSAFRLIDALLLRPLAHRVARASLRRYLRRHGCRPQARNVRSSSYPMFERMRAAVHDQAESIAVSYADRVDLTFGVRPRKWSAPTCSSSRARCSPPSASGPPRAASSPPATMSHQVLTPSP